MITNYRTRGGGEWIKIIKKIDNVIYTDFNDCSTENLFDLVMRAQKFHIQIGNFFIDKQVFKKVII